MYRRFKWLLLPAALLLLSGCRYPPDDISIPVVNPTPLPMPESALVKLSFSESASYFKRIQGYEFRSENGKHTAYFYMANEDEPYPVPVDQAWVDTLTGFIGQYGMMGWDGFCGSDSMLLDGTQFSVCFTFADGTSVHASGYGRFPQNYGDASRAIDAHFLQLLPEDMRCW